MLPAAVMGGHALEHGIVGFGGAAGEDDLLGGAAQQGRDLLPGLAHRLPGLEPQGIVATGIAEFTFQIRPHGPENLRGHGGGGVVVQIDHGRARTCLRALLILSMSSLGISSIQADRRVLSIALI